MSCCVGANVTGYAGSASIALPASTFRHAGFDILIQRSVFSRHDLRQEPYAVAPLVRICAGGVQQWPSLPRPAEPHVESFNGRFLDECLNTNWFVNLTDARRKIEAWRKEYNEERPDGSLAYRTREEFAKICSEHASRMAATRPDRPSESGNRTAVLAGKGSLALCPGGHALADSAPPCSQSSGDGRFRRDGYRTVV